MFKKILFSTLTVIGMVYCIYAISYLFFGLSVILIPAEQLSAGPEDISSSKWFFLLSFLAFFIKTKPVKEVWKAFLNKLDYEDGIYEIKTAQQRSALYSRRSRPNRRKKLIPY